MLGVNKGVYMICSLYLHEIAFLFILLGSTADRLLKISASACPQEAAVTLQR